MPKNWPEINERLALPRTSPSPSKFNHDDFRKFKQADRHASKENPVIRSVIPIIPSTQDDLPMLPNFLEAKGPKDENGRPKYIMTQLKGYSMTNDHETFLAERPRLGKGVEG
ncbi:hypothetical protein V8E54_011612 [Elaphomyces granulatus]